MRILHLAAGNRWTGAAAPAFAEVCALRQAGVDAHYAYVGGYKLQAKIGHFDFAHPIIAKAQNPFSFASSMEAIERLLDHHGFDIVHAHLTYDHWLARFAARAWRTQIARTFHSSRVIRSDPFTKMLIGRAAPICVVNASLLNAPLIRNRGPVFTPPPLDDRHFRPDGANVRETYGISRDAIVIAAIGKLSADRGFETVLRSFAAIRKRIASARLMIIGHGERRPALESLTRDLSIDDAVIWAGYHEDDLADHYRAADFLLFNAKGSDEGHRAVIEAMACGTVPIVAPLPGIDVLVDEALIAADPTPAAIAGRLLQNVDAVDRLRVNVVEQAAQFAFPRAAERLMSAYSRVL
jgi:glycosyltransferase involved in cell wall biosynthesis